MAHQKLDTEVRQEQIIQAALDLIAVYGLRRLSMGAVARRVGLVPSALYRHFKNKEEMLEAVLGLVRKKVMENINRVSAATSSPLDRLERLLMLNAQMIREIQAIPRIVFSEGVYGEHPERKHKAYEMIKGLLARLEQIIREGQQEGQIRSDLDARTLAVSFWGLMPPVVILWHISDGRFDVTKHAEKSWQLFREAIRAR
jgi:TetR/AcrR family transcriptional regulator, fatty acid metabolism regulator protein